MSLNATRTRGPAAIERLYHLAEAANVPGILEHGLLSTARLAAQAGMPGRERDTFLRAHRTGNVRLPSGVVVRDQRPMPPAQLAPALGDGLTPPDWYALLNAHVFLWPDRDRLVRQRRACGDRPQRVLTFDAPALLERLGDHAVVSPINSGNARRKPAPRGRDTFVAYRSWARTAGPQVRGPRRPAEFLFSCVVPAVSPYLLDVTEI